MMSLVFCDRAHAVYEVQGGPEIGKGERTRDVMLVNHLPVRKLVTVLVKLRAFEGRDTAFAGYTSLFGKLSHGQALAFAPLILLRIRGGRLSSICAQACRLLAVAIGDRNPGAGCARLAQRYQIDINLT